MKKVILNKCFGGFDLSDEACILYANKKGIELDELYFDEDYREDSTLIEVVEELGDKANTIFSNLKIVEIPDDLDYVIDNYDGFETLHQKVHEW